MINTGIRRTSFSASTPFILRLLHAFPIVILFLLYSVFWTVPSGHALTYDDFNGVGINTGLWNIHDNSGIMTQSGGYLQANSPPNTVYGQLHSKAKFTGDFEVILEYSDFTATATQFTNDTPQISLQISSHSNGDEFIFIFRGRDGQNRFTSRGKLQGVWQQLFNALASMTAGQLKISRAGSTVRTYFKEGVDWVLLGTFNGAFTGDAQVQVSAYTGDNGTFGVKVDNVLYQPQQNWGQISGRVTKEGTTEPIAGLSIAASRYDTKEWGGNAQTQADGTYTITGLASGSYRVQTDRQPGVFWVEEFYNNTTNWGAATPVSVTAGQTTPNIDFGLSQGGKIGGYVRDEAGNPIGNMEVRISAGSWGTGTRSEANGYYESAGLPVGSYTVSVYPTALPYVTEWYSNKAAQSAATSVPVSLGQTTPNIDFSLSAGAGAISGRVVADSNGSPISGLYVDVLNPGTNEWMANAQTQADGRYTIFGLAPGLYRIRVQSSGLNYISEYYNNVMSSGQATLVSVIAGQTTPNIDFGLGAGGSISGRVTRDGTSDPVAGLSMSASRYDTNEWSSNAQTQADGTYTITGLGSGSYRVHTGRQAGVFWVEEYYNNTTNWGAAAPVQVTVGQTTPNIDFGLSQGGKISGYVRDEAGNPIGNMFVNVSAGSWGSGTSTQANGYYETAGLPPGSYTVSADPTRNGQSYLAEWYNNSPASSGAASVNVSANQVTPNIDFSLAAAGRITGRVTRASDGSPLQGIAINYRNTGIGVPGPTVYSGADGTYSINVVPDTYRLVAGAGSGYNIQYYSNAAQFGDASPVTVEAGQTIANVNFNLTAIVGGGTISFGGTLVDKFGNPIGGALVEVVNANPAITTTTDASGAFNLPALPAGNPFVCRFSKAGYLPTYSGVLNSNMDILGTFTLYAARDHANPLWTSQGAIGGRVVNRDDNNQNVEGALVVATSAFYPGTTYPVYYCDDAGVCSTSAMGTYSNGLFLIVNAPEDTVIVQASKAGWSFDPRSFHIFPDGIARSRVYGIPTASNMSLTGYIKDQAGAALPGVAGKRVGVDAVTVTTDDVGSFVYSGLPNNAGFYMTYAKGGYIPVYTALLKTSVPINNPSIWSGIMYPNGSFPGFASGKSMIGGYVVNSPSGTGIGGVVVTVHSGEKPSGNNYVVQYCDNAGVCSANPAGTYSNGRFLVYNVEPGDVIVARAERQGLDFTDRYFVTYPDAISEMVILPSLAITPNVENQNTSDGFSTWLDVTIESAFTGALPDGISAITVTGPTGNVIATLGDFTYSSQFRQFWVRLPGGLPVLGNYTFTVTGSGIKATGWDIQSINRNIPILNRNAFTYTTGTAPTFTWPAANFTECPLYYRLVINDMAGNRVYATNRILDMLSHSVPSGTLQLGQTYQFQVRVSDSSSLTGTMNSSRSSWVTFTVQEQGTITVNPDPNAINAPWTLAGPGSYSQSGSGDQTLSNLTPGNYTLTWGGVAGWEKPSPASVVQTLTSAGSLTFAGVYQTATGTVTINAEPDSINASWTLTGPHNYSLTGTGDRTLTNMTAGNYTVTWGPVADWNSPSPAVETRTLAVGGTQTFAGTYAQAPIVKVTPSALSFGTLPILTAKELTVTVQNTGTSILAGAAATALPFAVVSASGYSLAPGASQQVTVRYAPNQSGSHTGVLSFTGGAGATVSLSGTATAGPALQPGGVLAWGRNDEGQLGDGVTMGRKTPFQVPGLYDVKAVAGGSQHTLALKNDGTVWAWGTGGSGQLGNGTYNESRVPVPVSNLTNVIALAAGSSHSLALRSDGTVWAWGSGWNGELGMGINTSSNIPVQVTSLANVTAVAAGSNHSLAVKGDGTVWAWGSGGSGQLGNGTNSSSNIPVQVLNLTNMTAIAAGYYHSLAVRSDGTTWTWGSNQYGQLGNGTNSSSNIPVQVLSLTNVTAIAAGFHHSMAVRSEGTVWTWGLNGSGQLGNGIWGSNSNIPVQVLNISNAIGLAGGWAHSAALLADKTVSAWGDNSYAQLGDGTTSSANLPVQTQGISDVKAIAAGVHHTIAVKNDGTVWTWGSNQYSQLGDGLKTVSPTPGPVQNLSNVIGLAGGSKHTVALKSDKTVWTFGGNNMGQLGNGNTVSSNTPLLLAGLTDIKAVAAGREHTLALKNDGTVWVWGLGSSGQLGNGTYNSSNSPVQVSNLTNVIAVAAGSYHTLALRNDGTVWAWGQGWNGELGNGTSNSSSIPVQVSNLTNVITIAAGYLHSLAVTSDGTVWSWGWNGSGQLGNGTYNISNIPVQVLNLSNVTFVAAGYSHSLAVRSDGTARAWGSGSSGQLGNGSYGNQSVPVSVSNLTNVAAISGGEHHSLALKTDGTVWAWGSGSWGQTGNGNFWSYSTPNQVPGLAAVTGLAAGGYHSLAIGSSTGSGAVRIDPNPDSLNASWTLTGPDGAVTTGSGDRTVGVSLAGNYTVTWGDAAGYSKPSSETKSVTIGNTTVFTGTYQPMTGTVVVNPEPNEANAPWSITGPYGFVQSGTGDQSFSNMVIGNYTVSWSGKPGYERPTPSLVTQSLTQGQTLTLTGTYQTATGTVTITPQPAINAPWTLTGSYGYTQSGTGAATLTGRHSGYYTLTWGDVSGWTKPWPAFLTLLPGGSATFNGIYQPVGALDGWQPQAGGTAHLLGVAYSPDLDLFAAVGNNGTILTSPDGVTWTPRTSGTTNTLEKIAYGKSTFVAVGSGGTIRTSVDGLNWQTRVSGTTGILYGVTYANNLFVAVGQNGVILTSTSGETWTPQSSGVSRHLYGVGYGSGLYVVMGMEDIILTSTNSVTWTRQSSGISSVLWRVTYGNGTYVAIGASGSAMTSTSGFAWKRNFMGTGVSFNGLSFANGLFTAVGPNGSIATSSDGIVWQGHASGVTAELEDVAYGNGKLVVVGRNGTVLLSAAIRGAILVNASPDQINAPWSMSGPGGFSTTGLGDRHLAAPQTGSYTLTWGDVAGWRKPTPAQVTQNLSQGGILTFQGSYYQVSSGTVVINAEPAGVNTTAPWTLNGPNSFSRSGAGDTTLVDLDSGSYTLTWGNITGWTKPTPASETQTLNADGTITFTGTYTAETVSVPTVTGPAGGKPGQSYSYTASGSTSSLGHPVEYQFDWKGDGSDLSAWGAATRSKTWAQSGNYNVKARARCATHPEILSVWSTGLAVAISASTAVRTMPGYYGLGYPVLIQIAVTPDTGVQVYAVEDTPPAGWMVSEINESGSWDGVNKKVKWGPYFDNKVRTLTYKATPPVTETGKKIFSGSASFDGLVIPIGGTTEMDKGTFHPADTTLDYRIAISECTAYGFAWKTGATWSVEPNPIPIGYMTNACYLWKIGEVYHFDPNSTPPYVTGDAASTIARSTSSASKGADQSGDRKSSVSAPSVSTAKPTGQSRRLLTGQGPGSSRKVPTVAGQGVGGWHGITVEVTPARGIQGYAVEETLPVGSEVQGITNSGNWDRTNGKVKWGPFLDNMPRTLRYQIREAGASVSLTGSSVSSAGSRTSTGVARSTTFPPSLFAIKGLVSFDGADVTTVNTGILAKAGDGRNALYPVAWMDFDGDGRSDLAERTQPGHFLRMVLLDSGKERESKSYPLSTSLLLIGYGDMDGDGRSDIVWRDSMGGIHAWLMEGVNIREDRPIAHLPLDARVVGLGDMDGDGIADLIWQDMEGTVKVHTDTPATMVLGQTDRRSAPLWVGDFDGDGIADILWRDAANNLCVWLTRSADEEDLSSLQGRRYAPIPVPLSPRITEGMTILGTGDMNGDGIADILWRDADGSLEVWLMQGAGQPKLFSLGLPAQDWEVMGTGDYDGSGITGILWRYHPSAVYRVTMIEDMTNAQ